MVVVDPLTPWDPARERAGLTLFLPLGDPENLGAALRSAAAFSVERVVLLEEAAHPFHPRAIRAAAGACFDLALRSGPSLEALIEAPPPDLDLLVLDRDGEPLDSVPAAADRGLVVGEEGRGVPSRAGIAPGDDPDRGLGRFAQRSRRGRHRAVGAARARRRG